MSVLDTIASDTLGVAWRATTGTVDPWTKKNQVEQEAADLQQASGGTMDTATATAQAQNDVTVTLTTFRAADGSIGADPSQALDGLKRSLSTGAGILKWIVVAGAVGVVIYFIALEKTK